MAIFICLKNHIRKLFEMYISPQKKLVRLKSRLNHFFFRLARDNLE